VEPVTQEQFCPPGVNLIKLFFLVTDEEAKMSRRSCPYLFEVSVLTSCMFYNIDLCCLSYKTVFLSH